MKVFSGINHFFKLDMKLPPLVSSNDLFKAFEA